MITNSAQLAELLPRIAPADRIAIDTEADSLHCYFEKLCLIQISVDGDDFLVDPLAELDLQPLAAALQGKEMVVQGADFDLRLLRRAIGFVAHRVFDTVIASRLVGIREFSLAALIERFFEVKLSKGSQKANWAQRPLPKVMADYAMNDTHYLLPLAEKLEALLHEAGRHEWFRQSCERALEQAAIERVRDPEQAWRIAGSGTFTGRPAAVLRALWQWREREAQAVDRPTFHILQNSHLLDAAIGFCEGHRPEFRHFTPRRHRTFREAAEAALNLPDTEWPAPRPRGGPRATREMERRTEELKVQRDRIGKELDIDPSLIAARSTLEMIAADPAAAERTLLPWQRGLLQL